MSIRRHHVLLPLSIVFSFFFFATAALAAADCSLSAQDALGPSVSQWRRWDEMITSDMDYTAGGGDPSRDLELRVTFTQCDTTAT